MRLNRELPRLLFGCALSLCAAADVAAQTPPAAPTRRPWTIELHGGVLSGAAPAGGQGQLPPPGQTFAIATFQSRRVPTWFFGDGTLLFNQFRTGMIPPPPIPIPAMVPLDETLQRGMVRRQPGALLGATISRAIDDRIAIELSVDMHGGALQFTDAVRPAADATRNAYASALAAFWMTPSPATTEVTYTDDLGSEVRATGAMRVTLTRSPGLATYALAGAGGAWAIGNGPSLTLVGHNRPRSGDLLLIDETDTLTVTTNPKPGAVVIAGGGVDLATGGRSGVRIDARVHLTQDRTITRVTATPASGSDTVPIAVVRAANPTVVFSGTSFIEPSLSAQLTGFETFRASGWRAQIALTAGYFFRF
jgi:hypothetical protein